MPTSTQPLVLVYGPYNADGLAELGRRFEVRHLASRDPGELSEAERGEVRAVAVAGHLPNAVMDALPALEIVGHFGVGYDGVERCGDLQRRGHLDSLIVRKQQHHDDE